MAQVSVGSPVEPNLRPNMQRTFSASGRAASWEARLGMGGAPCPQFFGHGPNHRRDAIGDAEGATKDIRICVSGAATEGEALDVARAVSRSNLLKCAIHGEDPNWGRVLAALGTTSAAFDPDRIGVDFNGVPVCREGAAMPVEPVVDLSPLEVAIDIDLNHGGATATLWTNDLTAMYVHENSAYST